jgi:hypothetical protein
MAEHWNGGTGGKGSKPRPYSVSQKEFDDRWEMAFGKKKKDTLPEYELNKSTGEVEKVYTNAQWDPAFELDKIEVPVLEGEEEWAQEAIDEEQRRNEMKKDGFEE